MFVIRITLPLYSRVRRRLIVLFQMITARFVHMRWHLRRDEFPHWYMFIYPVQVYEEHLSIFTLEVLQSSA